MIKSVCQLIIVICIKVIRRVKLADDHKKVTGWMFLMTRSVMITL